MARMSMPVVPSGLSVMLVLIATEAVVPQAPEGAPEHRRGGAQRAGRAQSVFRPGGRTADHRAHPDVLGAGAPALAVDAQAFDLRCQARRTERAGHAGVVLSVHRFGGCSLLYRPAAASPGRELAVPRRRGGFAGRAQVPGSGGGTSTRMAGLLSPPHSMVTFSPGSSRCATCLLANVSR